MKHPGPKEHLEYIGDMTVSFALLEAAVQSIVWTLIGEGQRIGNIIKAELSFKNLRTLGLNLYQERYGEDSNFRTFNSLMKKVDELEDRRNQFTHSIWAVGKDSESLTRFKTTSKRNKGLHFQIEDVQTKDLADFVINIQKLYDEIQGIWIHLLDRGTPEAKIL
jgi:hypothetical protein